jgi:drug/metabolite transporter (DMT)-like permease
MDSKRWLFALMCAIWGLTWIAIKIGVRAVPPFAFAASRLLLAGSVLFLMARIGGRPAPRRGAWPRIVLAALLVNTVCYGALFWGMQFVASGLSAVINLSMIPVGLFAVGVLSNEESFSSRKLGVLALGVSGLGILFFPKLTSQGETGTLTGMLALVVGTAAYCWGSVLSRPLLREMDTRSLASLHNLIGGLGLAAFLFEPVGRDTWAALLRPEVLASWLFLSLGGTVVAFTIYLSLLRDWGPGRAGLYAFVSPIVAVLVGVVVYHEPFGGFEILGSAFMLGAAALAFQPSSRRSPGAEGIAPASAAE